MAVRKMTGRKYRSHSSRAASPIRSSRASLHPGSSSPRLHRVKGKEFQRRLTCPHCKPPIRSARSALPGPIRRRRSGKSSRSWSSVCRPPSRCRYIDALRHLCTRRQRELEGSAVICIIRVRQVAAVRRYDGPANRKPMPIPSGLVVKNASNRRSAFGIKSDPESRTTIATVSGASRHSDRTVRTRGRPVIEVMASTALMIKFKSTCCNCTRSPNTFGKSTANAVCNST